MADTIILVNGLPGSGKSTLATRLGEHLGWPVLSKDRVKEALAEVVGPAWPGLGGVAMETVWTMAARLDGGAIIDSWWFRARDIEHARAGLARCGADRCVEVWCSVPIELARSRYEARDRHEVHRDRRDMTKEWAAWAGAEPLGAAPVVVVDTAVDVDVTQVAAEVGESLGWFSRTGTRTGIRFHLDRSPRLDQGTGWVQNHTMSLLQGRLSSS